MWVTQAPGHLGDAASGTLGAAEAYCRAKCGRAAVEERCRELGVEFQPLIFESTGGIACEAEVVLPCINRIVAQKKRRPPWGCGNAILAKNPSGRSKAHALGLGTEGVWEGWRQGWFWEGDRRRGALGGADAIDGLGGEPLRGYAGRVAPSGIPWGIALRSTDQTP